MACCGAPRDWGRRRLSRATDRRRRRSTGPSSPPSAIRSAASNRDLHRRHGQGSERHRVSRLRQARRRLHDTRARGASRASLARQRRRMGLCDRRVLPRHDHRSREPGRDRRFRCRATSGISRAATATRSRALVPAPALSSLCSTTAISRSSAPSRSPTGSATRRPRPRQEFRPSRFDLRQLPEEEVYIATAPCRRSLAEPAPGSLNAPRLAIATSCSPRRPTFSPAAPCASSRCASFPSRRP